MLCGEDGSLSWVTRAGPRDKALGMERADSARTQRNEAHDRVLAEHSNPCAPANHHPEPPPINFHIAPVIFFSVVTGNPALRLYERFGFIKKDDGVCERCMSNCVTFALIGMPHGQCGGVLLEKKLLS